MTRKLERAIRREISIQEGERVRAFVVTIAPAGITFREKRRRSKNALPALSWTAAIARAHDVGTAPLLVPTDLPADLPPRPRKRRSSRP